MSRDAMLSSKQFERIVDNYSKAVEEMLHYQLALNMIIRNPTDAENIAQGALARFKREPISDV